MPIYEYGCDNCKEVQEAIQNYSDPPLSKCPKCGGELYKVMSKNSFRLKGDGWYVTDYKKAAIKSGEKTSKTVKKNENGTDSLKKNNNKVTEKTRKKKELKNIKDKKEKKS